MKPRKTMAEMAAEAATDSRGIVCPDCGCADLRVQNTRDGLSIIKRWRVCRNCGRRVVTQEKPLGVVISDPSLVPSQDTQQP